jgi:prevent-host-death family protein
MHREPVGTARAHFASLTNRVVYRRERVLLTRFGRDFAALVPLHDFDTLQELDDEQARAAALRAGVPVSAIIAARAAKELGVPYEPIVPPSGATG